MDWLLVESSQPEDPTSTPAEFLTDHISESVSLSEVQLQEIVSPAHTELAVQMK